MTPRRIIHWKSFWLGIVVLVFFGWAWLSTRTEEAMVYRIEGGNIYMATSGGGSVAAGWGAFGFATTGEAYAAVALEEEDVHYFAPAFEWGWEEGGHVAVAYWVVVLAFLFLWGAFLAWRWRRARKVMVEEARS